VDRPGLAAAQSPARKADKPAPGSAAPGAKKTVDKRASAARAPVTKRVQLAKTDPLAPLATGQSAKHRDKSAAQ
jgi:hypothetical protein